MKSLKKHIPGKNPGTDGSETLPQKEIYASGVHYHRLFETSRDGILILNAESGKIIDVNPFLIDLLGYPKDGIIGKELWEIEFLKEVVGSKKRLLELSQKGNSHYKDLQLESAAGHMIDVEFISNVYTENGQKLLQCNIRDVTQRKGIETDLETIRIGLAETKKLDDEVGEFAENIINTIREPLLVLNKDLQVIKANRSFYKFFKVNEEKTIGRLIYELGNNQWDIPELRELLETILPEKTTFENYEVQHVFSVIGKRTMLLNARQIIHSHGKEMIILLAIEDITDRKISEDSSSERERLTNEYLDILFNHAHVPILIWDADSVITRYNIAFEELIGYKLSDQGEIRLHILFPEEKVESSLDLIKRSLNDERPEIIEVDLLTKDNIIKTVLWNSTNILDAEGKKVVATVAQDITHRKLNEDALSILETRYRRLFESAKDGILILDAETGAIIDVNPFLVELLGYTKQDFKEMDVWEIGFFKDIAANKEKFLELQKKEYVRYENLPLETADGHKISVEFVSNVYLVNNKKVIQCNIRDITKRKKAEHDLIVSETRLRTLVQTIPDLIWVKDMEGVYLTCNPMFGRFFGAPEAEIAGKTDYDFVDRELADFFRLNDQKAISAGKPTSNEEWVTFADDGHRAYLDTIKAPMYDEKHNLMGVLGIGRDITERKDSENRIKQNEEKFETITENSADAIFITNKEGKYIYVNKQAVHLLGYSKEEFLTLTIVEIAPKNRVEEYFQIFQQLIITGNSYSEIELVRKDGSVVDMDLNAVLLPNGWVYGSCRDISGRKELEKELIKSKEKAEESDRLKSAFLANMSHEIRTPMNGILGFTGLLKEPHLTGEEQIEYIGIIEKSGNRMLNIINDIISISRIESGQIEISLSETNVYEQMKEVFDFFKPETDLKDIHLFFNNLPQDQTAEVMTDKEKLFAVLTNLVKNAIKFTREGSIEIGYEKKGDWLEFFVKDTGPGVPKEQRELIFDRFRQGSESLSRDYEGAGLGLSISRAYIEMLGGRIWVESGTNQHSHNDLAGDTGSTFYFTIPWVLAQGVKVDKMDEAVNKSEKKQPGNLKVLIVEDDSISVIFMSTITKKISKEILYARTGYEAVEVCRSHPDIDLVLMDMKMPKMDGYEATRLIRKFNKDVVIIAQTAYGLAGDKEKAIEAGCNDYIAKPVNQEMFLKIVKSNLLR